MGSERDIAHRYTGPFSEHFKVVAHEKWPCSIWFVTDRFIQRQYHSKFFENNFDMSKIISFQTFTLREICSFCNPILVLLYCLLFSFTFLKFF